MSNPNTLQCLINLVKMIEDDDITTVELDEARAAILMLKEQSTKTVIIEVSGGVAYVKEIAEGVTVIVRDYDTGETVDPDEGDPQLKTDEDGGRYYEEVCSNPSAF